VVAAQHERQTARAPPRGDCSRAASSCSRGDAPSGSSQSPRSARARSSRSRSRAGE
jgi:hypothetical protein